MGEAVAATMCSLAHTRVGKLASVARVCASRINFELFAQTTGKNLLAEYLLSHRRTTDIAQADK
jgi:hypothetical protein